MPDKPSSSLLRARTTIDYDEQGRPYSSTMFGVDPSSGSVSSYGLTASLWYDQRGDAIKSAVPGGLVTKTVYDGAGRPTIVYTSDGGGDSGWSDAGSVSGDHVLEQDETQYDAASNAIMTLTRQRFDDATGTGALGVPTSSAGGDGLVPARVSYMGYYYDAVNRLTDIVNVGTNGGSAWTRPSSAPTRSDTVLVTSYLWAETALPYQVTDPRGIDTSLLRDQADALVYSFEAYGTSSEKGVNYWFDPGGRFRELGIGDQDTYHDYAYAYEDGQTTLTVVHNGGADGSDVYTRDALGETVKAEDRNGNVHVYAYDVLGRLVSDTVATLGTGVDGAVRRIGYTYDGQGNVATVTSYSDTSGSTIVNQVQREYNGFGQLITEYEEYTGAVSTTTSPKVQYGYSTPSGSLNASRLTSMTYPNGRVITYDYGSGVDDAISRLVAIKDGSTTLESYTYLGLATVVTRAHPETGVDLSYISGSTGDGGDKYTGLDRFGRVVEQVWLNQSTSTETDHFTYTYDRDSNVLTRGNTLQTSLDQSFGYDDLNQLTSYSVGSSSRTWSFDTYGNATSYTDNGTTTYDNTFDDQNAQETYEDAGGTHTLASDDNGNMTTDPSGNTLTYDAWNRLVKVDSPAWGLPVVQFKYDGLGRRIYENYYTTPANGTPKHDYLYYSAAWQVIQETDASNGVIRQQNVWSPVYVDALIERDRDTDHNGTFDERLYVQQDANFNVTAIVTTSGTVVERYAYDAYGVPTILTGSWGSASSSAYDWRYLHQGGRYDVYTGLYSFRHRDYNPTLGRWIEQDPIGLAAGDVNLYRYEANRPARQVDPSGLDVRIESTDAVGGMHWRISVDTWNAFGTQRTGTYSISFGIDGNQPGSSSNGTNSSGGGSSGSSGGGSGSGSGSSNSGGSGGGPTARGSGSGIVYEDRDPVRSVIDTLATTREQDARIAGLLHALVGRRGNYSLAFYNCRSFSRQMFELIGAMVANGQLSDRRRMAR